VQKVVVLRQKVSGPQKDMVYGGSDADPPPTLTAHSSMDDGDSSASGLDIEIHLLLSSQDKKSHILSQEQCHFQIGECCSVQM